MGLLDARYLRPEPTDHDGCGRPAESDDGKTMDPLENYGVQVMSIGFLVDKDEAMIWRGPMATQALEQLLRQTNWQDLDYLIIDLPPGTGDIQLTLSQRVPMTGALIVTTPQDIALLDAKKEHQDVREGRWCRSSVWSRTWPCTSAATAATSSTSSARRAGKRMAEAGNMPYLGALPLDINIRLQADSGKPTVVSDPDGDVAQIYKSVARKVAVAIAEKGEGFFFEVSDDLDLKGHLILGHSSSQANASRLRRDRRPG